MNFWWVSHNQTFETAMRGGFLWSPKINQDGSRNYSYDNMSLAKPGDIVFSYAKTFVQAIGVVQSVANTAPKPFVGVGENWSDEGWNLDVEFHRLSQPLKIKQYLPEISQWIGQKYSPLQATGDGNMAYLSSIPEEFGIYLLAKAGTSQINMQRELNPEDETESRYEIELELKAKGIDGDLVKTQIVTSRRGQGVFKYNVRLVEDHCRVTNLKTIKHLRASHIKPWAKSTDAEKLDGNNGLLLSPHVDHLFDRGFISFERTGRILVSTSLSSDVLEKWSLHTERNVGAFNDSQALYLDFHQHEIFKG